LNPARQPPERLLERALVANLVIHAVAMLTMLALLIPALPGGTLPTDAARVEYVAAHPWRVRLGWVPWQLTALADLVLAVAIVRARWIPKAPAVAGLVFTLAAIVPDQLAQVLFQTQGIDLARAAVREGRPELYLAFERVWFPRTASWAACLYTAAAIAWSVAFARAGTWSRWLTWVSAAAWTTFAVVSASMLLPEPWRLPPVVVSGGNAVAFVLFELWILGVLEYVLRRSRPAEAHGKMAAWRHPHPRLGGVFDVVANSRAGRALLERAPAVALTSDVRDVVYVNYLLPAERLQPLVPDGLELQVVGGRWAVFSHLTFRHGSFGPRLLGPGRRFCPSPVQSNWRIHVRDPRRGTLGVSFVTTAVADTTLALLCRLGSEGLPMHVPAHGAVRRDPDGTLHLLIDPGRGTAPDLEATLHPVAGPAWRSPWSEVWPTFRDMLAYVVPQDRVLSTQPWHGWVSRHEIQLGIPLDACEPLEGEVRSRAAAAIVGDATPVCFRVPQVAFRFDAEERDRM
jgi:hypothetical protein